MLVQGDVQALVAASKKYELCLASQCEKQNECCFLMSDGMKGALLKCSSAIMWCNLQSRISPGEKKSN